MPHCPPEMADASAKATSEPTWAASSERSNEANVTKHAPATAEVVRRVFIMKCPLCCLMRVNIFGLLATSRPPATVSGTARRHATADEPTVDAAGRPVRRQLLVRRLALVRNSEDRVTFA